MHHLEDIPAYLLDVPALLSDTSTRSAEEALVAKFAAATRLTPSVLYFPRINLWWANASEPLRATFLDLLHRRQQQRDVSFLGRGVTNAREAASSAHAACEEPMKSGRLLLLATSTCSASELQPEIRSLFIPRDKELSTGACVSVSGAHGFLIGLFRTPPRHARRCFFARLAAVAEQSAMHAGNASEEIEFSNAPRRKRKRIPEPLPLAREDATSHVETQRREAARLEHERKLLVVSEKQLRRERHYLRELRIAMREPVCLATCFFS